MLKKTWCILWAFLGTLNLGLPSFAQQQGLQTINEEELRYHLDFLGAPEFRGRETPSPELEIATLYIGNWLKHKGFKPILADGSFYQTIPITVSSLSPQHSRLRVMAADGERVFYPGQSFEGSFYAPGSFCGQVVFVGLGQDDDLKDVDVSGKIVIILDQQPPGFKYELGSTYSYRLYPRIFALREKGAEAVFSIIDPLRAGKQAAGECVFNDIPNGRMDILYDSQRRGTATPAVPIPPPHFAYVQIDHQVAAAMMGKTQAQVAELFKTVQNGKKLERWQSERVKVRLEVEFETRPATTRNVIAQVEGSDPQLKNEYIVVCAHHDHLGISDGEIIAGADDNGSGTVALMEIARALQRERPKRTVILAWFTGEERGYMGSQHFVNHCPVPIEKISACLNMDMLGRNDPGHLFLVGSDLLSSELDGAIHTANDRYAIGFNFDYTYSNLTHPQRVYFRSDQYPLIRFGIPAVWFFCGFTQDYHTPRDRVEFIDYPKVLKVTRLVYLTAMDIGNMPSLLKLDVNPEVTLRGPHNLPTKSLYDNTK